MIVKLVVVIGQGTVALAVMLKSENAHQQDNEGKQPEEVISYFNFTNYDWLWFW